MNDFSFVLKCEEIKNTLFGFSWIRLQCKLLKHTLVSPMENWRDIFSLREQDDCKTSLALLNCKGLDMHHDDIHIGICSSCESLERCRKNLTQQVMREHLYDYIKSTIVKDHELSRHIHANKDILHVISNIGLMVVLNRKNKNEYEFKTLYFPVNHIKKRIYEISNWFISSKSRYIKKRSTECFFARGSNTLPSEF